MLQQNTTDIEPAIYMRMKTKYYKQKKKGNSTKRKTVRENEEAGNAIIYFEMLSNARRSDVVGRLPSSSLAMLRFLARSGFLLSSLG